MKMKPLSMIILISIFILSCSFVGSYAQESLKDSQLKITSAKEKIRFSYKLILDIEDVGGDASVIISRLNLLLEDVDRVERASKTEVDNVSDLARNILLDASKIEEDVIKLGEVAFARAEIIERNRNLVSRIEVVLIILFGYLGWRWFKQYYCDRIMSMRPEVIYDESR